MGEPAAPGKAPEVKYDYPGHETDDKAISKVEDALKSRFSDSYKEGLADSAKDAPIHEDEAKGQIDKAKQDASSEAKTNPDAQKELKEGPPPPSQIGGAKPDVHAANPTTGGPKTPQGGAHAPAPKAPAKAGAPANKGATAVPAAPTPIVLAAAQSGDKNLDAFLDGYKPRAPETKERLSKITEMAEIAKGFDGKMESSVATGSGALEGPKNAAIDFLGKKEMNQTFGDNPYDKVKDRLGGLMSGISRVQGFISIVGNVCSKLGIVLTILGLFGFIFPPIGAAISAVARVLNVVGLICDALGLILSGVLTGLNGVVLARTIGKGGSNEEKAAIADLMMGEANAAGGHLMNLAMAYGGKFMAGIKGAAKGVIGSLFKRFKGVVGKFVAKALGPVANWAKKIGYKLFGAAEKGAANAEKGMLGKAMEKTSSFAKKAWNAPGKGLEKLREQKWVKAINGSEKMKGLEKWSGKVNNSAFAKLDGEGLEHLGKKAGEKVFTKNLEKRMEASAEVSAREAAEAAEKNAVQDASNREKMKIEQEAAAARKTGNQQYEDSIKNGGGDKLDEGKAVASRESYEKADKLDAGKDKAVAKAEKDASKDAKKEFNEKSAEERKDKATEADKERREEQNKKEWKDDPDKFQKKTERMERDAHDQDRKANNANVNPTKREEAKEKAEEIRKKIEERKTTSQLVGGKEEPNGPENLWQVLNPINGEAKETWEHLHLKDQTTENQEKRDEWVKKDMGHEKNEAREKDERHEKIENWEEKKSEGPNVSEHVEGLLDGLDEELGIEPHDEDHDDEKKGDEEPDAAPGGEHKDEQPDAAPANDEKKDDKKEEPAASKEEKKEEPGGGGDEKKEDKDSETPALAYWPSLVGPGGEFAKAATELGKMKMIAYAFRKAQAEAKKKAIESAMAFNAQGKDMSKKQQHAADHSKVTQGSVDEVGANGGAAQNAGGKADEGNAEQNKAKGPANGGAQAAPDAGDKPSLFHPIKRIWWYVKKWVSDKAAAVFGWIQEKIASLVLKCICGISMDDLKGYTTALNHRMQYSKLVGSQGIQKANQTMQESMTDEQKAKSYEQQALDDAAECDTNMADADAFVQQVQETERDLVAEQAKAAAFLSQLHAAVQAEKARKEAEAAKKKADAQAQKSAANGPVANAPTASSTPAVVPKKQPGEKKPKEPKPLSPAAVSKVKNAASYVAAQTHVVIEQLTSSKQEQASRFKTKLGEKSLIKKMTFNVNGIGAPVLDTARASAGEITSSVNAVNGANPSSAGELKKLAGDIKSKAQQVDSFSQTAQENLNKAFKTSYDAIAKSA